MIREEGHKSFDLISSNFRVLGVAACFTYLGTFSGEERIILERILDRNNLARFNDPSFLDKVSCHSTSFNSTNQRWPQTAHRRCLKPSFTSQANPFQITKQTTITPKAQNGPFSRRCQNTRRSPPAKILGRASHRNEASLGRYLQVVR